MISWRKQRSAKRAAFPLFYKQDRTIHFSHDYAARYISLEIKSSMSGNTKDYFALRKIIAFADMQIMGNYPYMLLFVERAAEENDSSATAVIEVKDRIWTEDERSVWKLRSFSIQRSAGHTNVLARCLIIRYAVMYKHANEGTLVPEKVFGESNDMIEQMKRFVIWDIW